MTKIQRSNNTIEQHKDTVNKEIWGKKKNKNKVLDGDRIKEMIIIVTKKLFNHRVHNKRGNLVDEWGIKEKIKEIWEEKELHKWWIKTKASIHGK